jgi:hypothetical protein
MDYASWLIEKYRGGAIVVDTNLMLLLAVGLYNPARIVTFKRTQKYNAQIFEIVTSVVERFGIWYTTPYIVTEVDNLSRSLLDQEWEAISVVLRRLIASSEELYSRSVLLLENPLHREIGITDASIAIMPQDALIFTDDLRLALRLERDGREVLNLSHLLAAR